MDQARLTGKEGVAGVDPDGAVDDLRVRSLGEHGEEVARSFDVGSI